MQFEVFTLFPEMFDSFLGTSLIDKAIQKKLLEVQLYNFRKHGLGKHKHVDDLPYGGGSGMLLRIEPIHQALLVREKYYQQLQKQVHKVLLSPQGQPFNQSKAKQLLESEKTLFLVCGRYEGFDERIRTLVDEEISGGDFICFGGEVIAMLMIEVIGRLVEGVLGNQDSSKEESFNENLLEYPQYTRPSSFNGVKVPEVLLSGNHQKIKEWREKESRRRTQERRPDLFTFQ